MTVTGLYFAYVGYLTWFRFSRGAIRHICVATLFWVFLAVRIPIKLVSEDNRVQGLFSIVLIVGLVWLYRRAWRHFSNLIFGRQEPKVTG